MVRADVPDFDTLQSQVALATVGLDIQTVLDLGTGTGATAAALLDVHPSARIIGVDELEWLTAARLQPSVVWTSKDLAVVAADRPLDS